MITEEYFHELVKDLFLDYLPKIKAADRKEFSVALLDELKSQGFDFEEVDNASDRYENANPYSDD